MRTPALKDIDKDSGKAMYLLKCALSIIANLCINLQLESEENVGVAGGETDEIVPDWWVVEHAKQVRSSSFIKRRSL